MLGLEGYGSGSDDASDDDDGGGRVTLIARDDPPAPAPARAPSPPTRPDAPPAPRQPLDFASKLPPPKVTTGNLFASLPPPGASAKGGKRVVQFRAPLKTSALAAADAAADADADEDHSAKRRKTAPAQRASLADLLPKPKADAALGAGRASGGVLGGGVGEGGGATIDLGDAAGPGPSSAAAAAADASAPAQGPAMHPSQMYAVDETGGYTHAAHHQYQAWAPYPEHPGSNPTATAGASGFDVDAALAAAMAEERARGGTGAGVREMNLDALRAGARPVEAASATGLAFGDEYRDKLQREAGAKPSATHKAKNQIGSLLYNAKQAELKIMEGRLQGVSHKAMSKQKYGW